MASETFLAELKSNPGTRIKNIDLTESQHQDALTDGNKHSTKFTQTMAKDFAENWKVVDHISNTKTGFSGTLFEATQTITDSQGNVIAEAGQQVMSFRSTKFVEDAVHDNKMTNTREIKKKGFAFGQISDRVDWIA